MSPFYALPARRLAEIALEFEGEIKKIGLQGAFTGVYPNFARKAQVWGAMLQAHGRKAPANRRPDVRFDEHFARVIEGYFCNWR